MMPANPLNGEIVFHLGATGGRIINTRPALANRLLRGSSIESAPQKLATVFSLCGQAHELTAQLAIDIALGSKTVDRKSGLQTLHLSTLAEHLRRIWLDWPRLFGDVQYSGELKDLGTGLALCRQNSDGVVNPAIQQWVEEYILHTNTQQWLDAWQTNPSTCLDHWINASTSYPAKIMSLIADEARLLQFKGAHLQPPEGHAAMQSWHLPFESAGMNGHPPSHFETGVWTRLQDTFQHVNAWTRLGARIAEIARLATQNFSYLQLQGMKIGNGKAVAWSEMARGLLVHEVTLDAGNRTILDYHIYAPTDCNFHPNGLLKSILNNMNPSVLNFEQSKRKLAMLVGTLDPCIPYRVELDYA